MEKLQIATGKISGVVLAGGEGKRFGGRTKSRIMVGGKTIISRIIDTIDDIFEEIMIITNKPEEFKEYGRYKIIEDEFLNVGPLGGIHAAMKASSKKAIFVFAGDMPLIEKEIILKQISYFERQSPDVLIPRSGRLIEPLHSIYRISLLDVLENYLLENNERAVWEFFSRVKAEYFELDESRETRNAFMNINTPEDIIIAENVLKKRIS